MNSDRENNPNAELHLFIVWHNAKSFYQRIVSDLENKFLIADIFDVQWDESSFLTNLISFYSHSQHHLNDENIISLMEYKKKYIGTGSFYVILVKDNHPTYSTRETSSGKQTVNTNVFDSKEMYRRWTGGGHLIHATNSPKEFVKDSVLLFGVDFNIENKTWDRKVEKISRNVTGAGGWAGIEELFFVLNISLQYIVLRNFELLPGNYYFNEHGDVDLLVEDLNLIRYLTGAQAVFAETYRVHYKISINNEDIYFDFRYLGDDYYDIKWEKDLLQTKEFKDGIFRPSIEHYFYSLLYHALIHKTSISFDYRERLMRVGKEIGVIGSLDDLDDYTLGIKLVNFINRNEYKITKPLDLSVIYNQSFVDQLSSLVLEENVVDFSIPFQLIKPEEKLISSHFLTHFEGIDYWSCVYDDENRIYKQATMELAKREMYFLARLDSDYFPKALDSWSKDNYSVVVLKKIDGKPLQKLGYIFREDLDKMYGFVNDCLAILDHLKKERFVHRDIRQANILIRNDKPVLLDFGWALSDQNRIFTPVLLGGPERPPDGNYCDVYSMGKVIEQVNQDRYPGVSFVTRLMTASDPYLRVTNISLLQFLLPLVRDYFANYEVGFDSEIHNEYSINSSENEAAALQLLEKIDRYAGRLEYFKNRQRSLEGEILRKEETIKSLVEQLSAQVAQVEEKENLQIRLSKDNSILQQKLDLVYKSRLWRWLQPIRAVIIFFRQVKSSIYDAIQLTNTKRERFVLLQNPNQADIDLDQLHCIIDNKDIDDGTLVLHGWAFHEKWKIQRISLLVSTASRETRSTALTYKKERMDVFEQYRFKNALHSGFWGEARPVNQKSQFSLLFELENEIHIIFDFETSAIKDNLVTRIIHRFQVMFRLITMPRIKKALTYFIRGNFPYIKERIAHLFRENLKRDVKKNNLELAYCAQFFNAPSKEDRSLPLEEKIDIIVPIYNGMEYLERLFDCLMKNTNTPFRVIVVDDHSPDPAIWPFLQEFAQRNSNVLLLRNDHNKGFVRTVNYAAVFVQNHFVILNTDVEVPAGWLQRLMEPILNGSKVASTTPFTNAGTICSFPKPLIDNPIFGDLDLGVIDSVFQRVNMSTISIELPTGVGFCMGINMEAWKKIGPFDEKRFGRGYGEENDWCMRASLIGYQNLMTPNLFVYHKHGGSFDSEEKQKLVHENLQKLHGLYPDYQGLVEKFIKADPLEPIRKFASLSVMGIASSEKSLLLIDHEVGGGANSYRKQLMENRLQAGQTVLLLTYDISQRSIKIQAFYQDYEELFYISSVNDLYILPKHLQIGEIFYNNLVSFDEPMNMLNAIYHLQELSGARLTIAVHDYYPLCTSYTLLDQTGHYCDLPSIETCKACLPRNPYRNQNDPHDIVNWRLEWAGLLRVASNIICFSESSANLLRRVYDISQDRITIQPHKTLIQLSRKPKVDFRAPLNIGVVGALNYAKGAQIVADVAKIFSRQNPSVKITVIGVLNGVIPLSNVTVTGRYDISRLPDILEEYGVNLCFFPSIWPETFSYVVSELMDLEMPICAFNIGAPAERIRKYKLGYLISEIDAEASVKEMVEFYALLRNKKKNEEI